MKRPEACCEEVVSKEREHDDGESGMRSVSNMVETLTMLDNICQCPELGNPAIEALYAIIERLQTLQLQKKKQESLNKCVKV